MNLPELIEQYGTEDRCREYLEDLRWPNGVFCARCGEMSTSWIEKRKQHECNACRYQFSVTAGTVFHDSHLPLWKWFLAIYLIGESKKGISAKQLQRTLGVSYKTAWYLGHRIRSAMEEDSPVPLHGIVEIDETFIGGKARNVILLIGDGMGDSEITIARNYAKGATSLLPDHPGRRSSTDLDDGYHAVHYGNLHNPARSVHPSTGHPRRLPDIGPAAPTHV